MLSCSPPPHGASAWAPRGHGSEHVNARHCVACRFAPIFYSFAQYFKPFPDMKVLIIRMQYPDLAMQDPDMYWDYNGTFGFNGTFAAQIAQSSQVWV